MSSIETFRREIDKLHVELHELFERRRVLVEAIWEIKTQSGMPLFAPKREAEIIHRFAEKVEDSAGPLVKELHVGLMKALLVEYRGYLESKYSVK
jgi:chorismate mutase